jgi:hypothetical protein
MTKPRQALTTLLNLTQYLKHSHLMCLKCIVSLTTLDQPPSAVKTGLDRGEGDQVFCISAIFQGKRILPPLLPFTVSDLDLVINVAQPPRRY